MADFTPDDLSREIPCDEAPRIGGLGLLPLGRQGDEAIVGVENAKTTLEAGFTTVRNVGANGWTDVALRGARAEAPVYGAFRCVWCEMSNLAQIGRGDDANVPNGEN